MRLPARKDRGHAPFQTDASNTPGAISPGLAEELVERTSEIAMTDMRSAEMQHCIDECESCHDVCLRAVGHSLHQGGRHAETSHITMLLDCADMCATSAAFMLRESTMHDGRARCAPTSVSRVREISRR